MNTLNQIINTVKKSSKEPFDWGDFDKAILELQSKINKIEWSIEDEYIEREYKKILTQYVALKLKKEV
jgi:hypothetical protein